MVSYKAWFEKYRPITLDEIIFPNETIQNTLYDFYNNEFIRGNVLSYGPPGFGKTSVSEVMIHKIIRDVNDIFVLGRKTEDIDNLKRWLQQRPIHSKQKIVKIEEMDRLSRQAQVVLKDGLMEKYQHQTAFLATTNNPEKIDNALVTRFNTKINFSQLPKDQLHLKLATILNKEQVQFSEEDLTNFVQNYGDRGLRDLINNLELASNGGIFKPETIGAFSGVSESETLIIQYIVYLIKFVEFKDAAQIAEIIKNPKVDSNFFLYYEYILKIFKSDLRLNWDMIYRELSESDLDLSAKNIIGVFWQDLDLKRFKTTHTIALIHELLLNVYQQKGGEYYKGNLWKI